MRKSMYRTLGASNHTKEARENMDFYATHPIATQYLIQLESFNKNIWEPACGIGHISKELEEAGYIVKSTDLVDRGYGIGGVNFLEQNKKFMGDIITNPPYKYAQQFVEQAIELIPYNHKVAMFLKIQFLESKSRKKLFKKYPPKVVYVSSSRIQCAKGGDFNIGLSAIAYCWFVWIKGFTGDPILKWFN